MTVEAKNLMLAARERALVHERRSSSLTKLMMLNCFTGFFKPGQTIYLHDLVSDYTETSDVAIEAINNLRDQTFFISSSTGSAEVKSWTSGELSRLFAVYVRTHQILIESFCTDATDDERQNLCKQMIKHKSVISPEQTRYEIQPIFWRGLIDHANARSHLCIGEHSFPQFLVARIEYSLTMREELSHVWNFQALARSLSTGDCDRAMAIFSNQMIGVEDAILQDNQDLKSKNIYWQGAAKRHYSS